jgi:hypothetical protein
MQLQATVVSSIKPARRRIECACATLVGWSATQQRRGHPQADLQYDPIKDLPRIAEAGVPGFHLENF